MSVAPGPYEYVRSLVYDRSGVVLGGDKSYLVESRLGPVATRRGFGSLAEFILHLRRVSFGEAHQDAIEALLTNETHFFRDLRPFEALIDHVIPSLLEKLGPSERLRIWSAACSTGQEPYTIAMLVHQKFPQLCDGRIEIVASDVSTSRLRIASAAVYTKLEINRGLPIAYLTRYFEKEGEKWKLDPKISKLVDFQTVNLLQPWPYLPRMHIIFLRNVLIYFDVPTKQAVLGRAIELLRSEGFLFLGGAETPVGISERLLRCEWDRAGCYRIDQEAS